MDEVCYENGVQSIKLRARARFDQDPVARSKNRITSSDRDTVVRPVRVGLSRGVMAGSRKAFLPSSISQSLHRSFSVLQIHMTLSAMRSIDLFRCH